MLPILLAALGILILVAGVTLLVRSRRQETVEPLDVSESESPETIAIAESVVDKVVDKVVDEAEAETSTADAPVTETPIVAEATRIAVAAELTDDRAEIEAELHELSEPHTDLPATASEVVETPASDETEDSDGTEDVEFGPAADELVIDLDEEEADERRQHAIVEAAVVTESAMDIIRIDIGIEAEPIRHHHEHTHHQVHHHHH